MNQKSPSLLAAESEQITFLGNDEIIQAIPTIPQKENIESHLIVPIAEQKFMEDDMNFGTIGSLQLPYLTVVVRKIVKCSKPPVIETWLHIYLSS